LGGLTPKQSRVQRLDVEMARSPAFDGDKSPAESAAKSAHSKALGATVIARDKLAVWDNGGTTG
jgi:hypothetical protein